MYWADVAAVRNTGVVSPPSLVILYPALILFFDRLETVGPQYADLSPPISEQLHDFTQRNATLGRGPYRFRFRGCAQFKFAD